MFLADRAPAVRSDGKQDDHALQGFLPLWLQMQEDQGRGNGGKKKDTGGDAPQISSSAGDRYSADDGGGDRLEFQALTRFRIDVWKPHRGEQRREPREATHQNEYSEGDFLGMDARKSCRLLVRADGINKASRRNVLEGEREEKEQKNGDGDDRELSRLLAKAKPLESLGKIADKLALTPPPQCLTPSHHGCECHDDGRNTQERDQCSVKAPMITPQETATIPTTGIGQPALAARPAKTLQRAN